MAPTNTVQDQETSITARPMRGDDVGDALALMRELAQVEGYLQHFTVSEESLLSHGFGPVASFKAFVAQRGEGPLLGLAVTYLIPWTYDLRPTVVLKELVVAEASRGQGVGQVLMARVARYGVELGAARVLWTVLKDNLGAKRFYTRCGAHADTTWENWGLDEPAMDQLSRSG